MEVGVDRSLTLAIGLGVDGKVTTDRRRVTGAA